jgi:probable rRNA maturation factor
MIVIDTIYSKKTNFIKFNNFPNKYVKLLKRTALIVLKCEKIKKYYLNFIIIDDNDMKKINFFYKKKKKKTDIISFLLIPKYFIGDIYISKEYTKKQAKKNKILWKYELSYLVIHGILHFCGYTDYDYNSMKKMFKRQDVLFNSIFN